MSKVWAQAKVGHSFPSPRYGHTLVCVPGGYNHSASITMRHAMSRLDLLLFGGLNAMYGLACFRGARDRILTQAAVGRYCPGELWALHVVHPSLESEAALVAKELRDREPMMSRSMSSLKLDALEQQTRAWLRV